MQQGRSPASQWLVSLRGGCLARQLRNCQQAWGATRIRACVRYCVPLTTAGQCRATSQPLHCSTPGQPVHISCECPTWQHPPAQVMQHNPAKPHKCSLNNFRRLRGSKGTPNCNSHSPFSSALNNIAQLHLRLQGRVGRKAREYKWIQQTPSHVCVCVSSEAAAWQVGMHLNFKAPVHGSRPRNGCHSLNTSTPLTLAHNTRQESNACVCNCSSHGASALQGDERLAACLLYFPELTEFAPGGRA